ncbi:MAG TPA: hypothetical protein VHI52_20465, partial [Verrucomicrobiae bacterium]|nr:hypothetical protein [Verrucomicrobiae bacterium]
ALSSGLLSGLGYGVGKLSEAGVNALIRPGINASNWAATGSWSGGGWNLLSPNNFAPIGGSIGGASGQEVINGIYKQMQSQPGAKK